jgi:hypothetical protein
MYDHTRNVPYQALKLGRLEDVFKITNSNFYKIDPKSFLEKLKEVLDVTFEYRRDKDYEKALGEVFLVINELVNNQRLEAKEDLYTLLKHEDAENTADD